MYSRPLFLYTCTKDNSSEYTVEIFEITPEKETSAGFYLDPNVQVGLSKYGHFSNPVLRMYLDNIVRKPADRSFAMLSLNDDNLPFFINKISEDIVKEIDEAKETIRDLKAQQANINGLLRKIQGFETLPEEYEEEEII